jgi:hypothetical protein
MVTLISETLKGSNQDIITAEAALNAAKVKQALFAESLDDIKNVLEKFV